LSSGSNHIRGGVALFQIDVEAPGLNISGAIDPWGLVIRCEGEIDISNLDALRTLLHAAKELEISQVHLDLRGVAFFDGSLVQLLLQTLAGMIKAKRDATLTLQVLPEQLRPFRLGGAHRALRFYCDEFTCPATPTGGKDCGEYGD
jgi:anti-anti-sigma factor